LEKLNEMAELHEPQSKEMKAMNRNTLNQALAGAAMLFAMLSVSNVNAQSTQALDVRAEVPEVCVIDVPGTDTLMDFGILDVLPAANFTASANFAWRCSLGTAITIAIDAGLTGTVDARLMAGPGLPLPYNLYTDTTYGVVWGDGTASTVIVPETGLGMTAVGTSTIEGRILIGDAEVADVGIYNDTVTITMLP
jgi:spore coat protein U-like protein